MVGIHTAHSLDVGGDVCRGMGLGIPAFGVAAVRGAGQGQDGLYAPGVDPQRNLPAGNSTNLGGVSAGFLLDGDRATATNKIILLHERNAAAASSPIDQTRWFLRHRRDGRHDCTVRLDTLRRALRDPGHRAEFGAAITSTTGTPDVDYTQTSVTRIWDYD